MMLSLSVTPGLQRRFIKQLSCNLAFRREVSQSWPASDLFTWFRLLLSLHLLCVYM